MQKNENKGFYKYFLFGGPTTKYNNSMVISCLDKTKMDIKPLIDHIYTDLQDMLDIVYDDKSPDVTTCLLIDVDEQKCEQISCTKTNTVVEKIEPSNLVYEMLKQFTSLKDIGFPDSNMEIFMNDKLQEIFLKSTILENHLRGVTKISIGELSKWMKLEPNDVRFLLDVISVYSCQNVAKVI